jgi:hypothetical protein
MPRLLQAWWRTPRRLAVTGLVLGLVLLIPGIFVPALWVTSALLLAATLTTLAVLAVLDRRPGHHLLVDAVGGIVLTAVLGPMLVWPWTRLDTTLTTGADWSVQLDFAPSGPVLVTATHAFWLDEDGGLVSVDLEDGAVNDAYAGPRLRPADRPGLPVHVDDVTSLHARMIADDAAVFTTGRRGSRGGRIALVTNGGQSLLTRSITAYDITPIAYDKGILVVEACGYRTVPHRQCTVLGLDDRLNTAWSVAERLQAGQPWSTYTGPLPAVAIARTQAGLVRLSADRGQPILTVTKSDLVPITLDDPQLPPSPDDNAASSVGGTEQGLLVQEVAADGCRLLWFATDVQAPADSTATSDRCGSVVATGPTTFVLWRGQSFWGYEAGSDEIDVLREDTWINAVTGLRAIDTDQDNPRYADALEPNAIDPAWRFDPPGDQVEAIAATRGNRFVGYLVVGWNPLRARDAGLYLGRLNATTGALTAIVKGELSTTDPGASDGFAAFGPTGSILVIDRQDDRLRYYDAP